MIFSFGIFNNSRAKLNNSY